MGCRCGLSSSATQEEELVNVIEPVHNQFHVLLDVILKSSGLAARFGKVEGKFSTEFYVAERAANGLGPAFDALLDAATIFDAVCGKATPGFNMKNEVSGMKHLMGL